MADKSLSVHLRDARRDVGFWRDKCCTHVCSPTTLVEAAVIEAQTDDVHVNVDTQTTHIATVSLDTQTEVASTRSVATQTDETPAVHGRHRPAIFKR
jgi:hypothetical protein